MQGELLTGLQHLVWSESEGIGHLLLNRPPSNEMTSALFHEMNELVAILRNEKNLRGIIIRGAGRHFSSGAALDELLPRIEHSAFPGDTTVEEHFLYQNYRSLAFFEEAEIPVIATVRGVCLGSAFELALLCHFRLCSDDAVFGLPETTFNLIPGLGGIRKISALAGKAQALELVLRGRTFGAGEALELGLVDRIVPKKELEENARSLIRLVTPGYRKDKRAVYLQRYLS